MSRSTSFLDLGGRRLRLVLGGPEPVIEGLPERLTVADVERLVAMIHEEQGRADPGARPDWRRGVQAR